MFIEIHAELGLFDARNDDAIGLKYGYRLWVRKVALKQTGRRQESYGLTEARKSEEVSSKTAPSAPAYRLAPAWL